MQQFGVLSLGSRLKRISDTLFSEVQSLYERCELPISSTYFPILRLLQAEGAMTVVAIADHLGLSHPAVSKQTNKMIHEGLLLKEPHDTDQRKFLLRLSSSAIAAMRSAEPILQAMEQVLRRTLHFSSEHFMEALEMLEHEFLKAGLASKVLDRLEPFDFLEYQPTYQREFEALHMGWLTKFFPEQITEFDKALLTHPEQIYDQGGSILLAVSRDSRRLIGSVVMLEQGEVMNVLKLAVVTHCQGLGVGEVLLNHAVARAEKAGLKKVALESASSLKPAMALYEKRGFELKPPPQASQYERADVYMEKLLLGEQQ
ncbi:bifunctional helix-turn-helix transcriptional regulator/GNAT family N-acetyltransferase [Marinomonas epiphytica]